MRVSIHTLGSRGDVQPYVALALGLLGRGHEVKLAAPEPFASFVEARGVRFAPLPGGFLALLDTPEGKAAVAGGQGFSAGLKLVGHAKPLMRRLLDDEWNAARGFGPDVIVHHPKSLASRLDPVALSGMVAEALSRAGKRGLLATGGSALAPRSAPSHVHAISGAPHDRLFWLVSAVLHHGRAGTTGASLRAGLPTIICTFFGDQPFWSRRVAALGAGPAPLDRRRLSVEALAAAFRATDEPAVRRRASEIGASIAQEDGVAAAVSFIKRPGSRAAP
jgi:UDP:flavonoid glycosyltransferase YjiC (YdhE family)